MTDARRGDRTPEYLQVLGTRFADLERAEPGGRRAGWPGGVLLAAAVAVLVAFLAATPPGRSVAGELGTLVGIGDEPTEPVWAGERGVVIGAGEAAESYRYEVVAQTNGGATCIAPQFPDVPKSRGPDGVFNCLTDESREALPERIVMPITYPAPQGFPTASGFILQGTTTPEVAAVAVTYQDADGNDAEAVVSFSRLDEELSRKIGVSDQAGFFLAFLPQAIFEVDPTEPLAARISAIDEALSRVEVVAQDVGGGELLRNDLGDEKFAPWFLPPEEWCRSVAPGNCEFELRIGRDRAVSPTGGTDD